MGGMLLKLWGLPPTRLSLYHYREACLALKNYFGEANISFPRNVDAKDSFGDIDVLLPTLAGYTEIKALIEGCPFNRGFYVASCNGNVFSIPLTFGDNTAQVDFIVTYPDDLECHSAYLDFESGMLMGVIARHMGLSYGHNGLYLRHSFGDRVENIFVTKNVTEIFDILGFDLNKFARGFSHREDLYNWVLGSKYFQPGLFDLQALTHKNRTRNRKRPSYGGFLEFVSRNFVNKEPLAINITEIGKEILTRYPHISGDIDARRTELLRRTERQKKFNRFLVNLITGFSGKELGDFIVEFKSQHTDFDVYLDSNLWVKVSQDVEDFYKMRLQKSQNTIKSK